jgi:prepilin-type N-terminal cleavage/methylation domain-containing protein
VTGEGPVRGGAGRTPHVRGYTLIELVTVLAIAGTCLTMAIPLTQTAVDEIRTAAAARHVAEQIAGARLDAVRRSAAVGFRFEPRGADYRFTTYVDGNANGLRSAEITSGADRLSARPEYLGEKHANVRFGLRPGVADLDGGRGSEDGVRIGSARILTLSPDGTATSGTLYVRGRRSQYAIRILGATARVRVFQYDTGAGRWVPRG